MLATISSIQEFESAFGLMRAGTFGLQFGMLLAVGLFVLSLFSILRKDERLAHAARRGQYALLAVTGFCVGLLYLGIFDGYFFIGYIERVTETSEDIPFKVSALWASQQGSLLFWCFILTIVSSAYAFTQRHNHTDRKLPYTLMVLALVQVFFFYILCNPFDAVAAASSNPFTTSFSWLVTDPGMGASVTDLLANPPEGISRARYEVLDLFARSGLGGQTPGQIHGTIAGDAGSLPAEIQRWLLAVSHEGSGLNPALHNYWIAIHPPLLYFGFVGFTIPFAYAVGALLSGEVHEGWLKPIRIWAMIAWLFLTVGIALGGLWAYEILGWGGYWAWDPVENASFIPWLTGTAFIHSVIVTERRGMMRAWSFALIILTYCMTVIGTFLVRSGILNSVHAFGNTGVKDPFYFFIAVIFLGSLLALVWRLPLLKSSHKFESLISREAAFLFNNLVLLGIAATTLLVTFWPLITGYLYGEGGVQELGADAYVMINVPLFLLLLLLTGLGPAIGWRRNTGRQLLRTLLIPVSVGLVVALVNAGWLIHRELLVETDRADAIAKFAAWVRWTTQLTLLPICAFILSTVTQEFVNAARARRRNTGQFLPAALLAITFGNRRRYGGYIVHIGIALLAIGIYFSSMYESEGTVVTTPGGFGILEDRLSDNRYLVYFDEQEETEGWDSLQARFGNDSGGDQAYRGLLRTVMAEPDKGTAEFLEDILAAAPNLTAENRAKMTAAFSWAVSIRDHPRVYESNTATLRIFPYREPEEVSSKEFLAEHDALIAVIAGNQLSGDSTNDAAVRHLERLGELGVQLGSVLPQVLKMVRETLTSLPDDKLKELLALPAGSDSSQVSRLRYEFVDQLQDLHSMIEARTIATRRRIVRNLALRLDEDAAAQTLLAMRPLSLLGLRSALESAPEEKRDRISAEIEAILAEAWTVKPRMRIFYDKRTGMPRVSEPEKDPAIERSFGRDLYFILQDVQPDNTAIFRFFVKPQMMTALTGLFIMVLGTVLALLPSLRRRRPEVG